MKQITKEEFTRLYNTHTNKEIAIFLDVNKATIWSWAKKLNLPPKNKTKSTWIRKAKLIKN